MKDFRQNKELLKNEIKHPILNVYRKDKNGVFLVRSPTSNNQNMAVICSNGEGWDHVSISLSNRCPNWEEMNHIKNLFFKEEETVIQFHPKKSEYVNKCRNCLHLWRDQKNEHKLPPQIMVG